MAHFIPSFHFVNPEDKLKTPFCMEVVNYHVYNTQNRNLLAGKRIDEIEEFSSGNIDMKRFKKMFRSMKKAIDSAPKNVDGSLNETHIANQDTTGLSWEPLPLIPQKLNSAIATINKIPIEPQCVAQDGLAMKKKKEDIEFLKNKPLIEADLQDVADKLQIGKVDIGTTKHSGKKFSESPMGMDLTDPDEEDIFSKLLYSLNVESANEKALQQFYYLTKAILVKGMEIEDQFKWGVSVHDGFTNSMTGLPSVEYVFPGDIETVHSKLKDCSDVTHIIQNKQVTALELFNYFSDEICDEDTLFRIMNEEKYGYCRCNGTKNAVSRNHFGTYKVNLKLIEVKSIDWVGVKEDRKGRRVVRTFTTNEKECTSKIWAQNTYRFWWLENTQHCFGIERLPFSHRTKGKESYQNFSFSIYKSQKKSAVELAISENKKAQIADIKMEHALIMSLPSGKYVDLRFLRGALTGLNEDERKKWTLQDIVNLAFERNIMIGDTEGFEGKNDGQMKPFIDIPGGLKTEVAGYISVILNADRNIANLTGINEQLTGQSANPEGLVGLQKLLINSSINAIHYCHEAIQHQYQCLFNVWGSLLQGAIEKGGKVKEGIINFIGLDDTELLDGLNETPLHNLTIKVLVGQRELERQIYNNALLKLQDKGMLSAVDEYLLSGIDNPKERFAYLAVKEKRFMKKQDQIRQEQFAQQQQLVQQQGQNMVQAKEVEGQKDIEKIYAKGDVDGKIKQLSEQLGLSRLQTEGLLKMALQRDRNIAQKDKSLATIREKVNAQQQEALV